MTRASSIVLDRGEEGESHNRSVLGLSSTVGQFRRRELVGGALAGHLAGPQGLVDGEVAGALHGDVRVGAAPLAVSGVGVAPVALVGVGAAAVSVGRDAGAGRCAGAHQSGHTGGRHVAHALDEVLEGLCQFSRLIHLWQASTVCHLEQCSFCGVQFGIAVHHCIDCR